MSVAISATLPAPAQMDMFTALFGVLLKPELAAELLDGIGLDHLHAMIDEHKLRAINIAIGAEKRHLRIWRWSLDAHRYPALARRLRKDGPPPLPSLLPHSRESFWTLEVRRLLDCSDQHVLNLHAAALLTGRRDGTSRLLRIDRTSLLHFLATREIS